MERDLKFSWQPFFLFCTSPWCLKIPSRKSTFFLDHFYSLPPHPHLDHKCLGLNSQFMLPSTPWNAMWIVPVDCRQRGVETGLTHPAFFYPLNISLPLTSRMSACHTLFWEQSKSPSGQEIIKKQRYESWHLMNNYFKNLFLSVPSTPDGWVGSTKLLSQTLMRTSLKQGASCPYLFIFETKFWRSKFTQRFYCESAQSKGQWLWM